MKNILTMVAILVSVAAFGQTKTPFATTPSPIANRYAYTNNGLWVDSTLKLLKYKVLGTDTMLLVIDSSGKVFTISKSSGGGGGGADLGLGDSTATSRMITSSSGTDVVLRSVNNSYAGLMSSAMKMKLDSLTVGGGGGGGADSAIYATLYRLDTTRTRINGDLNGKVPMGRQLTINGVTYDLSSNRSWTISGADSAVYATLYRLDTTRTRTNADLNGKVPTGRQLTINGVTYDLSSNRSWTISGADSAVYATLYRLDTTRTRINGDLNGKVPMGRQLTINGVTYDLSSNRSWTISGADSAVYATLYRLDTTRTRINGDLNGKVPMGRQLTINGVTYDLSSNRSWTISGADSAMYATLYRLDTAKTAIRAAIATKENAFSKGSIIEGSGVSISGTLTNRLVGSGDITISATGSAGYVQWSDTTAGQLVPKYRIDTMRTRVNADLNDKVPTGRQLTINGVTYDLSSNRSWTISGADSAIYATLYRLDTAKTALRAAIATKGSGTVTSVGISSTDLSISGSPITTSGNITANINNGAVTDSKIRNSNGLSVIGRSVNSTGAVADITASSDYQVLRRSGTSIGFGSVNIASSNAVTGVLPVANGGTGTSTLTGVHIGNGSSAVSAVAGTANQLLRRNAANTAYEFFTPSYITGNQTITLSGDVTGSGTTSISTVIPSNTVTYAKMQGVNGSKLLGRYNSFSGTVQEVGLGSGLSFDTASGTLSATGGGGSPTLTENYIGFGNSSNLLTGDSSLTFNGSRVILIKPSGQPEYLLGRGWDSSLYGRFIIPTANISYTATDFKDMPVLYGSSPGLGLVSGDNGIKINSTTSGGIEFWAGYGEKLKLSNAGVRLSSLATWGSSKMVTVDGGGDLGTADIVPVAGAVYTPTATLGSDVSSHTLGKAMYQRVGDVIDVSITGSMTTTGSTAAWVEFTLPISSNLNNTFDLIGQGVIHSSSKSSVLVVEGNASTDRAKVTIKNDISGNVLANSTYDYTINFKYIKQ